MSYVYYTLGLGLTLFIIVDLIWTTLWLDGGAGPLSDRLTTLTWKVIKRIDNKYLSNLTGPLILSLTILSWFLLMWLGVTLFFAGHPDAIFNPETGVAITWSERFYFTGFTLFTLGLGDYSPQPGFFQVATAVTSGMGMLLLTFGASYIISIVSAVVEKRSFARNVTGVGLTSAEFIKTAWNGRDFFQIDLTLAQLNSQITKLTQQNQAFPLLQYYHSENDEKSSVVAISVLDEALTFLHYGLKDKGKVNTTLLKATRSSIENYLNTIIDGYGNQTKEINEFPKKMDLSALDETAIPMTSQKEYNEKLAKISTRRNQLLSIVKVDNHQWPNE